MALGCSGCRRRSLAMLRTIKRIIGICDDCGKGVARGHVYNYDIRDGVRVVVHKNCKNPLGEKK